MKISERIAGRQRDAAFRRELAKRTWSPPLQPGEPSLAAAVNRLAEVLEKATAPAPVLPMCNNCETALPGGCDGVFRGEPGCPWKPPCERPLPPLPEPTVLPSVLVENPAGAFGPLFTAGQMIAYAEAARA